MALSKPGRARRAGRLYRAAALFCLFLLGFAPAGQAQSRRAGGQVDHVASLIRQLHSPSADIRVTAAGALGDAKDARAVEPLIAALKDSDKDVRESAAQALGEIKDARAVEPLIGALGDADEDVKVSAAKALGAIGDDRAVAPLMAAMREVALIDYPLLSQSYLEDSCQDSLRAIGAPSVEPLIAVLNTDSSLNVREVAAKILGKIGDARAVDPLFAALKGTDSEDLRGVASRALGGIGEPSVEKLIGALNDQDTEVRWYAARALADPYDARVTAAEDPRDTAPEERAKAIQPGDYGEKALIAALGEHNLAVVAGGYRFFYDWGGPGAEKGLIEAMDQFGKQEMVQFFLNHGDADLLAAAENWAKGHGYVIKPSFQSP